MNKMTQKAIGPSFYDELVAHGGLVGEHFTWTAEGDIAFFEDTPQAVIDGVSAVYKAHDPSTPSWSNFKLQAQVELDCSDVTIMRCAESAIPVPSDWATYRKALRAIVGTEAGDASKGLPVKPPYPKGT